MNWLDRARREIRKGARRPTTITADKTLTAVTAMPHTALLEESEASIGSNGSATPYRILETEPMHEDFEERAAIIEFDGGFSRREAELAALELILKKHSLH
jgi:hypothetical protein